MAHWVWLFACFFSIWGCEEVRGWVDLFEVSTLNVINVMICVKCSWSFSQDSGSWHGFAQCLYCFQLEHNTWCEHNSPCGASELLVGSVIYWSLLEWHLHYREHAKKPVPNPRYKLTSLKLLNKVFWSWWPNLGKRKTIPWRQYFGDDKLKRLLFLRLGNC